jgi:hypothetical protein
MVFSFGCWLRVTIAHRGAHPAGREIDRGMAGRGAALLRRLQDRRRVRPDLLGDGLEGLVLGAAPVLDRGRVHPAGVGDEVGHDEDAAGVQACLGILGDRDVGALEDQPGAPALDVVAVDHVRARRRNPDLALDVK